MATSNGGAFSVFSELKPCDMGPTLTVIFLISPHYTNLGTKLPKQIKQWSHDLVSICKQILKKSAYTVLPYMVSRWEKLGL